MWMRFSVRECCDDERAWLPCRHLSRSQRLSMSVYACFSERVLPRWCGSVQFRIHVTRYVKGMHVSARQCCSWRRGYISCAWLGHRGSG